MQLRLISWFFIALNFMEYIGSQHASRVRRQGRRRYVPATSMRASIQGCVLNFNQAFKSNRSQGVCVTYVKVAAEGQADKMSSDIEVPTEQRRGTEFLYAGKMPPIGIHQCLLNVSGDPTANVNTVRQWVVHFITDSGSPLLVQIVTSMTLHPNVSQGCQGGCATCSDYNGCLSCKPRLFFVLERIGMKQIGVCLSSCPSGYYGTRYPDINKCAKCKADCDTCFTRNFCTKCKSGFYLYSGKCLEKCPDGLEANNHTMECTSIVHCEASEWSPWSPCTKKGKTCGFKRGNEVRVREIVQHPSARGNPCPATSESRKCMVQRKRCQKEGKGKKNREEKRKKSNKDESKESKQESKGRAARRQNREQRENNNKTQPKKRKAPSKEQNLAPVDTAH